MEYTIAEIDKKIERHVGSHQDLLRLHRRAATLAVEDGPSAIAELASVMFRRIADFRTLRCAWDYLEKNGGQAPGPDGLTYSHFSRAEKFAHLRATSDDIRRGDYMPGETRTVQIPKTSGDGFRVLQIPDIVDRVVQRAVVEIVQPVLDPQFEEFSFGYRPRRDRRDALWLAEELMVRKNRYVWVTTDIKDAFDQVPVRRLLDIVRKYLPNDHLVKFIGTVIGLPRRRGINQGSPLSPLLLNVYLHHILDRVWRERFPRVPMIRVADDILILCRNTREANRSWEALEKILTPAGMPLKESKSSSIHDITQNDSAIWLGFQCRFSEELELRLSYRAWNHLELKLKEARARQLPDDRVQAIIHGWVAQAGPSFFYEGGRSFHAENILDECNCVEGLSRNYGFDAVVHCDDLFQLWEKAWEEFMELRPVGLYA